MPVREQVPEGRLAGCWRGGRIETGAITYSGVAGAGTEAVGCFRGLERSFRNTCERIALLKCGGSIAVPEPRPLVSYRPRTVAGKSPDRSGAEGNRRPRVSVRGRGGRIAADRSSPSMSNDCLRLCGATLALGAIRVALWCKCSSVAAESSRAGEVVSYGCPSPN